VTSCQDDSGWVELRAGGTAVTVRVLAVDLVRFALMLAFYPVCLLAGDAALAIDRALGSDTFGRFLAAVEFLDQGRP
jgi:hypothetical protein